MEIDREKAGLSGVSVKDVTDALLVGTSSSRYVAKNYWRDPRTGVDYQVQVQVPDRADEPSAADGNVASEEDQRPSNLMVRDVAKVQTGVAPGEIDRSNMQRYLSITANVEGEDLGRAAAEISKAIADAGDPPRGVRVLVRGQIAPMTEMFASLALGLGLSVVVILVMLTAYFQSFKLGLVSIGARARRGLRRGNHAPAFGHDAEHRVVHGLDHVHRRLGLELGAALDLHGRSLEGGRNGAAGGDRRGQRPAAAHPDDGPGDDPGDRADGPGPGRGQRNDRARWAAR